MKEYYIDPNKSYLDNRKRLVDEGHVMGISYLPLTYNHLKDVKMIKDIYRFSKIMNKKHGEAVEYEERHVHG